MKADNPPIKASDQSVVSAEIVAFSRALGHREADAQMRNPDDLAEKMIGPKYRLLLRPHIPMRWLHERLLPGNYYFHIARTKHFDQKLLEAVAAGVQQVVFLGAGNDSRSYRFSQELKGVRLFEVDFPGTQKRKKRNLRKIFGSLPSHVTYVPTDFTRDPLEERLMAAGFQPHLRSFFLWEGVMYYLPAQAADAILGFIAQHAAPGSSVLFDYITRAFVEGDTSTYGAQQMVKAYRWIEEPCLFGLEKEEMVSFLAARSFEVLSDLGPSGQEAAYLGLTKRRTLGFLRFAHAELRT